VAGGADARGLVDAHADVALSADVRFAGVQAHPYSHVRVLRPRVSGEVSLDRDRRGDGVLRAPEGDEERVSLGVHLAPAMRRHCGANDPLVL
jgi:hypothetical protein